MVMSGRSCSVSCIDLCCLLIVVRVCTVIVFGDIRAVLHARLWRFCRVCCSKRGRYTVCEVMCCIWTLLALPIASACSSLHHHSVPRPHYSHLILLLLPPHCRCPAAAVLSYSSRPCR